MHPLHMDVCKSACKRACLRADSRFDVYLKRQLHLCVCVRVNGQLSAVFGLERVEAPSQVCKNIKTQLTDDMKQETEGKRGRDG